MLRNRFRLTFYRRLLLLTAIPMLGLIGVGGAFLLRLHREFSDVAGDLRVLKAYRENLNELVAFHTQLNAERASALVFANTAPGTESEATFRSQVSNTDALKAQLLNTLATLSAGPAPQLNEERVKYIKDPLLTLLPETRAHVLERKISAAKIMGGYARPTFNSLVMPESFRPLLKTSQGLNFFDGLYTLNKMREIEAMIGSLYQLGSHGYSFKKEDVAIVRKQYFALTESETYLRRYFPDLRTHFDGVLKFDDASVAYWKYLADIAGTFTEGPLPPFAFKGTLPVLTNQRQELFAVSLDRGFSFTLAGMESLARERRHRTVVLSSIIGAALLLGLGVNLAVARSTQRHLRSTSVKIGESSDDVDSASRQLSSASEQISQNASATAAALQQISAALTEMTEAARSNETHVTTANKLASQARTSVDTGIDAVENLTTAMSSIKSSSGKITQIITRINEISFQTNLLALNAAVEAARAGAAGAGFSVVADEVRSLARHCAEAAAESSALIEESSRKTHAALDKSGEVVRAFKEISTQIREVSELVGRIGKNIGQQADNVGSVSSAVSEQDAVAQSIAAAAQQTSAAALSMRTQVESLNESVGMLDALLGHSAPSSALSGDRPISSNTETRALSPRETADVS